MTDMVVVESGNIMVITVSEGAANGGNQILSDATINITDITTNNATIAKHGFLPKLPNISAEFLNGVGAWVVPGGSGDMALASVQTVTGAKTFEDGKMVLRNVADTFSSTFTNTNTAARTYTLQDVTGVIALTADITGQNSGTNTGDQTISDATLATTDITTNNVTVAKHGFAPKLPNNIALFLNGLGAWTSPPGGGGGDMLAGTYDPTAVNGDAFSMNNMVEGVLTKIFTDAERAKLAGVAAGATANSSDVTLLARANHTGTQSADTILDGTTNKVLTANNAIKLSNIAVTQAVDLDAMEASINGLGSIVSLSGLWDASIGAFPGVGAAQAGESWIVSTGGTVGGIVFAANDRLLAILDNASTSVYASNWHKLDYTDVVLSVAGKTGAIVLTAADVAPSLDKNYVTDAQLVVLGNTSNVNSGDQILSDVTISLTDILTNNASTARHGFLPKLPNDSLLFLDGVGGWSSPPGGGGGDMLASTYDPLAVAGSAFLMDNMTEGATTKILTAAERTQLAGLGSAATSNIADFDPAGAAATAEANANIYSDGLVVGLIDDRGNFDASVNTYPSTGGSGVAGAILKGDLWTVSVAGVVSGASVTAGDLIRALADTPGATASNWAITENNLGYIAESSSNKSGDSVIANPSALLYPSQFGLAGYLDRRVGNMNAFNSHANIATATDITSYAGGICRVISAGQVISLPLLSSMTRGDAFTILAGSFGFTLQVSGADTIEDVGGATVTSISVPAEAVFRVVHTDTSWWVMSQNASPAAPVTGAAIDAQDFSLTLESGVANSNTDQYDKTLLYITPADGDSLGVFNGTTDTVLTSTEQSIDITALAQGAYDVYARDNAGILAFDTAPWGSTIARGYVHDIYRGMLYKPGDNTRRLIGSVTNHGNTSQVVTMTISSPCVVSFPAGTAPLMNAPIDLSTTGALATGLASGRYYATANGVLTPITDSQCCLSLTPGGSAITTTGSQSGVHTATMPSYLEDSNHVLSFSNYQNRRAKAMQIPFVYMSNNTYSSAGWRYHAGSRASVITIMNCFNDIPVSSEAGTYFKNNTIGKAAYLGIGLDVETQSNKTGEIGSLWQALANAPSSMKATFIAYAGVGVHTLGAVEYVDGGGVGVWNSSFKLVVYR